MKKEEIDDHIETIKWRMSHRNKKYLEPVLRAFETYDSKIYSEYLKYGDTRTLALNYACLQISEKFGITREMYEKHLDKSAGWYNCHYVLPESEVLVVSGQSTIKTKKSPNGLYMFGTDFVYHMGGSHSGPNVYGEPFSTKEDAIQAGLLVLEEQAHKQLARNDHTAKDKKMMADLLKEISKLKAPQLTLF